MEHFRESVRSQTLPLGPWDLVATVSNIPFTLYFKNANSNPAAPFMPSEVLTAALYHTLLEWPILAGHLVVNGRGHMFIVVDKDNLNMPDYKESESDVHYSAIETARFSWRAVPPTVATIVPVVSKDATGVIRMLNIHVVRLQANSGVIVFASITHCVTDGAGHGMFMKRWADTCKWMQVGSPGENPAPPYEFDRRAISRALPQEMAELSPVQRQVFTTNNAVGHYLSALSPVAVGDFFLTQARAVMPRVHTFHITRAAIAKLREQIVHAATMSRIISDNDIICALVSHALAKGLRDGDEQPEVKELWGRPAHVAADVQAPAADELLMLLVADIRPRLSALKDIAYTGGAVVSIPVAHVMDDIASTDDMIMAMSRASARTREQVDNITPALIRRLDYVYASDTGRGMHFWSEFGACRQKVLFTNQSRFAHYHCDFGNGPPQWVSGSPMTMPGVTAVLPVDPRSDGYDIVISDEPCVLESILANEFWNAHTQLVY